MLEKIKGASTKLAHGALKGASKASTNVRARAKKQNDQYFVGLDIGTEFVKALIGHVSPDGVSIEIIGVGRAHQGLSDMQAGAIADIASVVENCDKALTEAEGQAGVSVRTAIIGIAGELVKGTTTTVRVSRCV
jgi:cell division protein FtsA